MLSLNTNQSIIYFQEPPVRIIHRYDGKIYLRYKTGYYHYTAMSVGQTYDAIKGPLKITIQNKNTITYNIFITKETYNLLHIVDNSIDLFLPVRLPSQNNTQCLLHFFSTMTNHMIRFLKIT